MQELSEIEQQVVAEEEALLKMTMEAITADMATCRRKFELEKDLSRALNAEFVATTRNEDKAQLASDSAVSHALNQRKKNEYGDLERLLENPYFAHVVLSEDNHRGAPRQITYMLGDTANITAKIVDWRKAPISKIYYEYREGDTYDEEIQGEERRGTVLLRRGIQIHKGQLTRIILPTCELIRGDTGWSKQLTGRSRANQAGSSLPAINALLTPDQYKDISDTESGCLIMRGVAGSGKTSVALHRMSFLSGDTRGRAGLILVLSQSLKLYIQTTLHELKLEECSVYTVNEWLQAINKQQQLAEEPSTVRRIKRSAAAISVITEVALQHPTLSAKEIILTALSDKNRFLAADSTNLIHPDGLQQAFTLTESTYPTYSDRLLELFILQLLKKEISYPLKNGSAKAYTELVVDEVQDYAPLELEVALKSISSINRATLVGDEMQRLTSNQSTTLWRDILKRYADHKYVVLEISHRSTKEIMKLCDFVLQTPGRTNSGRTGRQPIHFIAHNEEAAVIRLSEWLKLATAKYPHRLSAVLCQNMGDAKLIHSYLKPHFAESVRIGDSQDFSFNAGIVVTTTELARGLEFPNLAIWNVSYDSYPSTAEIRNQLYIAISRAEENLAIVSINKPSPLLPLASHGITRVRVY